MINQQTVLYIYINVGFAFPKINTLSEIKKRLSLVFPYELKIHRGYYNISKSKLGDII